MGKLGSKNFVITGASGGIGAACAQRLSQEGATVTLAARRGDMLRDVVASLPGKAAWMEADVARLEDMQALVALALERFGRVDGIICNAGIMPSSPIGDGLVGDWDRTIDVNLRGVLYGIHAALPAMLEQPFANIIAISSVAAIQTSRAGSVYAATKLAVKKICEGLRRELAPRVSVTVIFPGAVATDLAFSIPHAEAREKMIEHLRVHGLDPMDIADAVYYALTQRPGASVNEIVIGPTA